MSEQESWKQLGSVAPETLAEARMQLHWGARLVAAADVLSAVTEGAGSLEWMAQVGCLAGRALEKAAGRRAGLRVAELCLVVLGEGGEEEAQLALDNLSADNALTWLKFSLGASDPLAMYTEDMPAHDIGSGGAFDAMDASVFEELDRWYANASAVLETVREGNQPASAVRCSAAALDIATWIEVDGSDDAADAGRIAVGLTPGGGEFGEPHWFVRPSPQPGKVPEGQLAGCGSWHTSDWLGALLSGANTVAAGDAAAQRARVEEFMASALEQCRGALA